MCQNCLRNPLHCILPPYITDKLAESPDKSLSNAAHHSQSFDDSFRISREIFQEKAEQERSILDFQGMTPDIKAKRSLEIYDAENHALLPGKLAWKEGDGTKFSDKDVKNVYRGGAETWLFYNKLFKRNSVNNMGMTIRQTVHYANNYTNAFWNGQQMVYGDGDGGIFSTFTGDIDIIGHELTHGVIQYEANLEYIGQSGALNESYADVFGIMIKQRALRQDVKKSNWLVGYNVLKGRKYALRSLAAPGTAYQNHPEIGTDPQPATMREYKNMTADNGGVHINSGIPNHVFYLLAIELGGFSWEKAGRIWYAALTDKNVLRKNAQFVDMQKATIVKAGALFGAGSLEEKAVINAWKAVGL